MYTSLGNKCTPFSLICNEFFQRVRNTECVCMCVCTNTKTSEKEYRKRAQGIEREWVNERKRNTASVVNEGEHARVEKSSLNENFILFSQPLYATSSRSFISRLLCHTLIYAMYIAGVVGWSTIINQTLPNILPMYLCCTDLHETWTCAQTNKWINERMKKKKRYNRRKCKIWSLYINGVKINRLENGQPTTVF